ncbi:hypothetical protein SAMN06298216_4297 [Spirosomataceae bacterium TFI 002]|nr:hypothetical protein SAMN06298216_4297 [Spirosomataceae bacterium TFI 002]
MKTNKNYSLKLLFFVLLSSVCFSSFGQLPYTETFETEGVGVRYQGNFFTAADVCTSPDYFKRTQVAPCPQNQNFAGNYSGNIVSTNIQGSYFIAGDDVCKADANENPLGSGEKAYTVIKTLDVSSFSSVNIQLAIAGEGLASGKETSDAFFIQIAFDGNVATGANVINGLPTSSNVNSGTYTNIGAFYGDGAPTGYFRQDADLNGAADPSGAALTPTFVDYTFVTATNGASKMSIRIVMQTCDGTEDLAFDNIRVTGLGSDPIASISATPNSKLENAGGSFTYSVQFDKNATNNTTVNFTLGGTAIRNSDYTVSGATFSNATTGSVVVNNGSNSANITFTPTADSNLEPDESIILNLTSGTGYNLGSVISKSVTIINDDTDAVAPLIAATGVNHDLLDGFSFVALEDFTSSQTFYFTENDFDNSLLNFTNQTEAVLKWVSPASVTKGHVFVVKETSLNTFSLFCSAGSGCGTITKTSTSGSFNPDQNGDAFTVYTDTNDDPTDFISQVHSTLFTGKVGSSGGNIPIESNPTSVFTNAVLVQGFPAVNAGRTEYKAANRNITVDRTIFQNIANWDHGETNQDLNPTSFTNIIISSGVALPKVNVTVNPISVVENSGNPIQYTFTLSENATFDYNINFDYSGVASINSDFTVAFSPSSGATMAGGTGTIKILSGTNSATITITPLADDILEQDENLLIALASGNFYEAGTSGSANSIIENDDTSDAKPEIAIVGAKHDGTDGLSVVALKNLTAGDVYYFTDNEYDKAKLAFDQNNEFVVKWTVPLGGFDQGKVMSFEETTTTSNLFTVSCSSGSCGTVELVSASSFIISPAGEIFYAYKDNNNDPSDGILAVSSIFQTGTEIARGGDIAAAQNAQLVYTSAILVDGFPIGGPAATAGRVEYDPTKRAVKVENSDFTNVSNWVFNGSIISLSNDPFTEIALLSPEIKVVDAANAEITSGSANSPSVSNNTNFGSICVGSTASKTYTIQNIGDTDLLLNGNPIIALGGINPSFFSVTTQASSLVTEGGNSNFIIEYNGSAAGTHTAIVSIANNDGDENPYTFTISGTTDALPTVADAGADVSLCGTFTATLAGNTPTIGLGTWSSDNGGTFSSINSPTSTFSGTAGNYTLTWSITNGSCPASTNDLTLNLYNVISDNTIGSATTICTGSAAPTLQGTAVLAGGTGSYTYQWQRSTTSATTGFTDIILANSASYDPGVLTSTMFYRRIVASGPCSDISNAVEITVDALPSVANAGQDISLCGTFTSTLAGNTPTLGTGQWTSNNGGTFSNINSPTSTFSGSAGNYILTWSITNGSCPASTNNLTLDFLEEISNNTIGSNSSICSGTAAPTLQQTAVLAGGSGSYTYQWQESSTSATTGFTDIGLANSAVYDPGVLTSTKFYRRVVTSGSCSDISNLVEITVFEPTVGILTGDATVCKGSNSGTLTLTTYVGDILRWESSNDGFNLVINSISNITSSLDYTNLNENTSYRVVTKNGPCVETNSNIVTVTVETAIAYEYTPLMPFGENFDEIEVCQNGNTNIDISATGSNIEYQWQVDEGVGFVDISNGGNYQGAQSDTLEISNTPNAIDGYKYRSMISNTCGVTPSDTFLLDVILLPVITQEPIGQTVCPQNETNFKIEANGEQLSYQWEVNTGNGFVSITPSANYSGINSDSLHLSNISPGMSGYQYRCVVSNSCVSIISASVLLEVDQQLVILAQPINQTVCEGGNAIFKAVVVHTGNIPLTYQWQRKLGTNWVDINSGGIYSIDDSLLEITNVPYWLNGSQFRCVMNGFCQTIPKSLNVHELAKFTKQASNVQICVGNSANFSVSASGTGITYRWQVNNGSGFKDLLDGGIYQGATQSTLTLNNPPSTVDGYIYRCILFGNGPCDPDSVKSSPRSISIGVSAEAQIISYQTDISTAVPLTQAVAYVFANNKIIQPNGKAAFQAGNAIILNSGFEAQSGAVFEAKIRNPCQISSSSTSNGGSIPAELIK